MTDLVDTFIENRWIVQPNHANTHGTAHGGNVMKWMDEVGAMAAMRFAGEMCVTARMSQVDFREPIQIGDTAVIQAYAYKAGTTSVRVRLRAFREDPKTGEMEETTESYSVYVAIDEDMNPVDVPDVTTATEKGERLRSEALDGEET